MKIKIYIVTYNDREVLNRNLSSLHDTDLSDVEITVINNHSNFFIEPKFTQVKVLHNSTRPDFSKGHLARNWNQAILNGFKDLNNPDCDILATCQDDTLWNADWKQSLIGIHQKYSFYACDWGDAMCSYLPQAVKTIGMWDERFNAISHQEGDYFLRAFLYNRDFSSINDVIHARVWNPTHSIIDRTQQHSREHNGRTDAMAYTSSLFWSKWGIDSQSWDIEKLKSMSTVPLIQNFVYYPYFEKNIDFVGKNYYNY